MSTPRPRLDSGSAAPKDRPPIWINGKQRPSFDLRAYGAYSLIATRAALGPVLACASAAAGGLQARIAAGAYPINTARLGRAADNLPKRPGIAATVGGIAALLGQTGNVVCPPPPAPESLAAYDALWRTRNGSGSGRLRGVDLDEAQSDPELHALRSNLPLRPHRQFRQIVAAQEVSLAGLAPQTPAPSVTPAPAMADPALLVMPDRAVTPPAPEEDTVLAIRSLIASDVSPAQPAASPPTLASLVASSAHPIQGATTDPAPRKHLPAWAKAILHQLQRATAFWLAWGLIVISMPVGLTMAAIAHLEGRDLRDLVENP